MQFDKEKRIFMVKKFHELKNSTLVQRAWRTEFKFLKAPTHKTISYWSETFNKQGAAVATGSSHSHVRVILQQDLHLKPYKVHECQLLKPGDYQERVQFAQWFLSRPVKTKNFFICSDEAIFLLN